MDKLWNNYTTMSKRACFEAVYVWGQIKQDYDRFGFSRKKTKSMKDGRQIYLEGLAKEYESVREISDQFSLFRQMEQALMMEVEECKKKVAVSVL